MSIALSRFSRSAWVLAVALGGYAARADIVRAYTYDSQGRVIRIERGGQSATYTYDYRGRVYSRAENGGNTAQKYLHDGAQVVAEYGAGGKRYLCGPGIDNVLGFHDGAARYLHRDGLGSVTLITDAAGRALERMSYDGYGSPTFRDAEYSARDANESSVGNRDLFTGREWEPGLGLYNYRARFYAPEVGRFVSPDPIGVSGGLNLYAYCENSPVNRVDPLGLEACQNESSVNTPPGALGTLAEWMPLSGLLIEGLKWKNGEADTKDLGVAVAMALPVGIGKGGKVVEEAFTSKDFAIGLGKYLDDFKGPAKTWRDFDTNPTDLSGDLTAVPEYVFDAMKEVVADGGKIRFNMKGVDEVGAFNVESEVYDTCTSQYLRGIYGNRNLLANTVFYNK